MGRRKKYKISTINFGKEGDPARELLEQYEKTHGKNKTSELIRNLVVGNLSANKEFDNYKIKTLIQERKKLFSDFKVTHNRIEANGEDLLALGMSDEAIQNLVDKGVEI